MSEYYNAPLFAAMVSWLTAQIIKTFFYFIKHRNFNRERILGAGGMPSSHSATVCALAVVILRIDGFNSVGFALAMVLAFVVMYDASGVRRAAGMHAREINRLRHIISEYDEMEIDKTEEIDYKNDINNDNENDVDKKIKELKEILGHTPMEVICGALLGMVIGMIISI